MTQLRDLFQLQWSSYLTRVGICLCLSAQPTTPTWMKLWFYLQKPTNLETYKEEFNVRSNLYPTYVPHERFSGLVNVIKMGRPILGFEEHISTTLWELRNSKPIISFELGEPSAKAAHKNQYPFLSLCWSQILSCSELKCDFFFKVFFLFLNSLNTEVIPSVPSVWLHYSNYSSLLRKLLASQSHLLCF